MIADRSAFEPRSTEPLPASGKVYISGKLHPLVRVPLREIQLNPTKGMNGKTTSNQSVRVYDCSGPWGDPSFKDGVEQGLPELRRPWIQARGDVQPVAKSYVPIAGRSTAVIPSALERPAFRAKPGK